MIDHEQYCRVHSREDGFIHCEDCFWSAACRLGGYTQGVWEYCCDFLYAPKEVQHEG